MHSIQYTAYPDHAVRPVPGAHLLEVEQQHRALALRALHRLRVRDQVAVLQQELLDGADVVAAAGPRVVRQVVQVLLAPVLDQSEVRIVVT